MQEKRYSLTETEIEDYVEARIEYSQYSADYILSNNIIEPVLPLPSEEVKPIDREQELKNNFYTFIHGVNQNPNYDIGKTIADRIFNWFMKNATPQPVISEEEIKEIRKELLEGIEAKDLLYIKMVLNKLDTFIYTHPQPIISEEEIKWISVEDRLPQPPVKSKLHAEEKPIVVKYRCSKCSDFGWLNMTLTVSCNECNPAGEWTNMSGKSKLNGEEEAK